MLVILLAFYVQGQLKINSDFAFDKQPQIPPVLP